MNINKENSQPVAIILADKPLDEDLQNIFGRQDLSSLMIAGNSVIEHVLMELQDLKITECIVLAKENAKQIQHIVGDTRRWGMNITVMNYSLSKDQVLREYKSLSSANGLLIVEVDRLRSHCLEKFLTEANNSEYSLLEGHCANQAIGVTLLKSNSSDFIINAMPIDLNNTTINLLSTTHDFHRANFDVVVGQFSGLEPSVQFNQTAGQRQHWSSNIDANAKRSMNDVMIEKHCRVGKGASLNSVILNHDVYIERNAFLENSIVMPNAIVSAQQPIKNAIINDDMVYPI